MCDLDRAKLSLFEKLYQNYVLLVLNRNLKFIYVGESIQTCLGIDKKNIENKNLIEAFPFVYKYIKEKKIFETIKSGKLFSTTLEISVDGTTTSIEVISILNVDSNEEYITCLCKKADEELTPICANCKDIRNNNNAWESIESFFSRKYGVKFTHGMCGKCMKELYPDIYS